MTEIVDVKTGEVLPPASAAQSSGSFGSLTVLEQAAIAEVQVGAMLALRNPRNEDQARDGILRACKRSTFARMSRYSIPNRGTGFTIRFAEEAVRLWGNIKFQRFIITNTAEEVVCKVCGWDLQTGTSYSEDVMIRKVVERKAPQGREILGQRTTSTGATVYLCVSNDEELVKDLRSQCARIERNIGLKLIPIDVREDALTQVEATSRNEVKADPEKAKRDVLDGFSGIGVRPVALQAYLGHPLDTITEAELVTLRGIYAAIRSGDMTWQSVMDGRDGAEPDDKAPEARKRAKPVVVAAGKGSVRKLEDPTREAAMVEMSRKCDLIAIRRHDLDPKEASVVNAKSAEVYMEFLERVGLTLSDTISDDSIAELDALLGAELAA